jgi:iron complex outermembrane receptor protein
VGMALSGEFRELGYEISSNQTPTDPVSCTGIQFNCNAPTATSTGTAPYINGATTPFPTATENVKEFALETEVPLLKDVFAAKDLSLNAAGRFTDYSTSGSVWTWKLGSVWAVDDALSFRVTRSRDIRAPTLADLDAPLSITFTPFQNLLTGVNSQMADHTHGNPALVPEKADTWTAGLVFTPHFIEGLSLAIDGYHIKIGDGLNGTYTRQPATQQACITSNFTGPACALYYPSLQNPQYIIDLTTNVGGFLTYGVDTELNYHHPIFDHNFSARLLVNWQPHLIYDQGVGGIADVGGAADGVGGLPAIPNFKGTLQLNYAVAQQWLVSVQERYRNALRQNGNSALIFDFGKQPPVFYTDVNFSYKPEVRRGNLEFYLNVRNFFNKQPDPWASSGGGSQIGSFGGWLQGDDPMGRYMTIGFRYKL